MVLEERYVQAAVWRLDQRGHPMIEKNQTQRMDQDDWEARIEAADRALTRLDDDETLGSNQKVVLGLSSLYVTPTGDIDATIRVEVKKLCKELDLRPIGFVALPTALVHKLRVDEGVPPTVILLSVSDGVVTVSLYKVGVLAGQGTITTENIVSELEGTLKKWKDIEVLPSRMLLYGTDETILEELKNILLKHPWPTRVAFLHFPKIDILPATLAAEAVSLAGAAEMEMETGEEKLRTENSRLTGESPKEETELKFEEVVVDREEQKKESEEAEESEDVVEEVVSEMGLQSEERILDQEPREAEEEISQENANVVIVAPESLGFRKGEDVLESRIENKTEEALEEPNQKSQKRKLTLSRLAIPSISFDRIHEVFSNAPLPIGGLPIVGAVILFVLAVSLYTWFIPKATVTVFTIPKLLEEKVSLTVNPTATVADAATKTIPGKNQEKVVSGQKTMTVSGKKDVGDPAKGTVTIYNKSLSERIFKSGTILIAKGLSFSLDSEVKVASATDSFNKREFGFSSGSVTASRLGPEGNLPVDTEFTFKDLSSEIVVARNDKPFTGGTSKEMTVVSRADYDALVKALTADLVEKAKAELASGVAGREKLIDGTITSSVTDKTFQEELDQEAKQLHGNITVKVVGISYSQEDIVALFSDLVQGKVPAGYALVPEQTASLVSDVKVKKDGTITLIARIKSVALPTVETRDIAKALAGKSIKQAEAYLRSVHGVAGMEVFTRWWFLKDRIPPNKANISISVALQE